MPTPIPSLKTRLASVLNVELNETKPDYDLAKVEQLEMLVQSLEEAIVNAVPDPLTDTQVATIVERVLAKRESGFDRRRKVAIILTCAAFWLLVANFCFQSLTTHRDPFSRLDALETSIANKVETSALDSLTQIMGDKVDVGNLPNLANLMFIVDHWSRVDFEPPGQGDGIFGADDHCPDLSGDLANQGCPADSLADSDGDSVINLLDSCSETVVGDRTKVIKAPAELNPKTHWVYQTDIDANLNLGCTIDERLDWNVLDTKVEANKPAGEKYSIIVNAAALVRGLSGTATCEVTNDAEGRIANAECHQ